MKQGEHFLENSRKKWIHAASNFIALVRFVKSWQIFLEVNSKKLYQSSGRKKKVVVLYSRPPQNVKLGSFSNDDGNDNVKKAIGWMLAKQQLCTCITLFSTFLYRHCTTTTWKCLTSRFMENVNEGRRIFLSGSVLSWVRCPRKNSL